MALLLRAWQTSCETKCNIYTLAEFGAQGRAWTLDVVLVELRNKVRVDDEAPC